MLRVARAVTNGRVGPTKGRRVRVLPKVDRMLPILEEAASGKGDHDYLFDCPQGVTSTRRT